MPTYQSPGVYVEEVAAGARPLEGVGHRRRRLRRPGRERARSTRPTLVSNWTQFTTTFGGFVAGSYLAQSVYGYFMNGGGNCYVVRIGQDGGPSGPAPRSARAKELAAAPQAQIGRLKVDVQSTRPCSRARSASRSPTPGGDSPTDDMFKLVVKRSGEVVEEFDRATLRPGQAERRDHGQRRLQADHSSRTPAPARSSGWPTARPRWSRRAPAAAVPSPRLSADDYVGDVAERTGFGGLEAVEEVTMLCVPDLMSAYQQGAIDLDTVQAVQTGDDRALRADGRPDRDPRPAARLQRPADQGVAGRQGALRLRCTPRSTGRGSRP